MKSITLRSIDDVLAGVRLTSILLVTQKLERYKDEWNFQKKEYETRMKLRNREDAFLTRYTQRGVKVSPVSVGDLNEGFLFQAGTFEIAVVAGEITYQSFSAARRLQAMMPAIPIFIEFCETTFDSKAATILAKAARFHSAEALLERIVYLTSVSKNPKKIDVPL